jgi:hypothetical protein
VVPPLLARHQRTSTMLKPTTRKTNTPHILASRPPSCAESLGPTSSRDSEVAHWKLSTVALGRGRVSPPRALGTNPDDSSRLRSGPPAGEALRLAMALTRGKTRSFVGNQPETRYSPMRTSACPRRNVDVRDTATRRTRIRLSGVRRAQQATMVRTSGGGRSEGERRVQRAPHGGAPNEEVLGSRLLS